MRLMLLPLPLLLAAAADRPIPEATPVGAAQFCITRHLIRETQVRSDSVIDFQMVGGKVFRTTLTAPCPGLGFQQAFSYATSIDELCASDLITVFYNGSLGGTGATCGLAPFQPVTLPAEPKRR